MIKVGDKFTQKRTNRLYVVRNVREIYGEPGVFFIKMDWHTKGGTVYAMRKPHIIIEADIAPVGFKVA